MDKTKGIPVLEYLFIIPTFNESLIIERSLGILVDFLNNNWKEKDKDWKIVVADNGSNDQTIDIVRRLMRSNSCIGIIAVDQRGRSNAIRKVVSTISSLYYCCIDADIPIELLYLNRVDELFRLSGADLVVGKRSGKRPLKRRILTGSLRVLNYLFWDISVSDSQCGFKVFNQKIASIIILQTKENGWFLDTELIALSTREKYKVVELPLVWIEQRFNKRKSKVHFFRDAYEGLRAFLRISTNLYPRFLRDIGSLCIAGFSVLVLYLCNFFVFNRNGFFTLEGEVQFKFFLFLAAALFCGITFLVSRIEFIPKRLGICIVIFWFILIAVVAILILPMGSQDSYWSLIMSKALTQYHFNPYNVAPVILSHDSWYVSLRSWQGLSMV